MILVKQLILNLHLDNTYAVSTTTSLVQKETKPFLCTLLVGFGQLPEYINAKTLVSFLKTL